MENHDQTAEEFSRRSAQLAAKKAAYIIKQEQKMENSEGVGVFALYMWGSLAAASLLLALASGIFSPIIGPNVGNDLIAHKQLNDRLKSNGETVTGLQLPITGVGDSGLARSQDQNERVVAILDPETTGAIAKQVQNAANGASTELHDQGEGTPDEPQPKPDARTGTLAAVIGSDPNPAQLGARYLALQRRAPDLFAGLEPRIKVSSSISQNTLDLIAGPFQTRDEVALFCRSVRLKLTLDCAASPYTGQNLFAENQ